MSSNQNHFQKSWTIDIALPREPPLLTPKQNGQHVDTPTKSHIKTQIYSKTPRKPLTLKASSQVHWKSLNTTL